MKQSTTSKETQEQSSVNAASVTLHETVYHHIFSLQLKFLLSNVV